MSYLTAVSETVPATPPVEVLDAVALAATVYERLLEDDREVRFDLDPLTGTLVISLRETSGRRLAALSASDVIDLAAGGSLT
ncbi:MAG: hypothetical protein ACRDL5_13365 [Solirubrobacteraceae bacterium]